MSIYSNEVTYSLLAGLAGSGAVSMYVMMARRSHHTVATGTPLSGLELIASLFDEYVPEYRNLQLFAYGSGAGSMSWLQGSRVMDVGWRCHCILLYLCSMSTYLNEGTCSLLARLPVSGTVSIS